VKHISVTTFIHILFTIALAILVATLYYFVTINKEKSKSDDVARYKFIAETLAYNLMLAPPEKNFLIFFSGGASIRL